MAEPAKENKAAPSSSLMIPDWTQLPDELLHFIMQKLENGFDVVHARSVSRSWRSTFPFPSCLLRPSYFLPGFDEFPRKSECLCILEKVPLFLLRIQTPLGTSASSASEYFLGEICRDESEGHMKLHSPIQLSLKMKIPGSDPTVRNMETCQILPLGHQYRMNYWNPQGLKITYTIGVAFLRLSKKGGGEEFVVVIRYGYDLLMLRSTEMMRWVRLNRFSDDAPCVDLVTFKGRFYALYHNNDIFVIDPYSLEATPLVSLPRMRSRNYLVPSGDDELFLVENFYPFPNSSFRDTKRFICRVSRLDEKTDKWVVVTDLGDRVLFIGHFGNVCCSGKNLPDNCGLSRNSIVFTNEARNVTYAYKYGVHTGRYEDDLNCWRFSRENRVRILSTSPGVALRV